MMTEPKRYPDLAGDGFIERPGLIVRWNGLEFGYAATADCFIWLRVRNEGGWWPVIDAMLDKVGITGAGAQRGHAARGASREDALRLPG